MSILRKIHAGLKDPQNIQRFFYVAANRKDLKVESRLGYSFSIPPHVSNNTACRVWKGEHEKEEIEILRKHFKKSASIIEVGSNFGVISRIALEEKLLEGGTMICIEPHPGSFAFLKANAFSQEDKHVEYDNCAIGHVNGNGGHSTFMLSKGMSSGLRSHIVTKSKHSPIQVPVRELSDYTEKMQGPYGLICDAEGGEIDIILQDKKSLDQCNQIMIELHHPKLTGRAETPKMILDELKDLGFSVEAQSDDSYYLSRNLPE